MMKIRNPMYSFSVDFTPGPEDTVLNVKPSSGAYVLGRVGGERTNTYTM